METKFTYPLECCHCIKLHFSIQVKRDIKMIILPKLEKRKNQNFNDIENKSKIIIGRNIIKDIEHLIADFSDCTMHEDSGMFKRFADRCLLDAKIFLDSINKEDYPEINFGVKISIIEQGLSIDCTKYNQYILQDIKTY